MPKQTKLNLTQLDIKSFVTDENIKGGVFTTICGHTKAHNCNSNVACSDTEPAWKCMEMSIGHCTNAQEVCPNPNL